MEKKVFKKAKKVIEEFFSKAGFAVDISLKLEEENKLELLLKSEEPQVLIGQQGRTLFEMQGLLAKILRKQLAEPLYLDLDVNSYKENKMRYLEDLAKTVADRVSLDGTEKALFPMTAYERRKVHTVLAERKDIITESRGEDPERRIIIRPA